MGVGKPVFVRQFIHLADMFHPVPGEIIYCYGKYQVMFQKMKGLQFVEGFPDTDKWSCW